MGIFKTFENIGRAAVGGIGKVGSAISESIPYEVTCKYCGISHRGSSIRRAISALQDDGSGCGRNEHEPVLTEKP
ncbi:hypothetical protein [Treponema sp.]|uniref:hypothetical protein n=1 Tax=Treponema sp. TaxID=166 RepID=UPI002600CEA5|nr:hypothetical protein [Treponema sp.]MBR4322709.1 hypothetical protein [Treponema sp.]